MVMLSEDMRRRIAALNRADLKHEVEVEVGEPDAVETPVNRPRKKTSASAKTEPPVPLPKDLQVVATVCRCTSSVAPR